MRLATHTLIALAFAAALTPGVADAQDEAEVREDQRRIAVLLVGVEVDPEVSDSLAEVVIGAIAAEISEASIMGREEVQAGLGQMEDHSSECISSNACLGRLGVELQVDEVIAGTISPREGGWAFNLNRIDIQNGEAVGRAYEEIQGDLGELAAALQRAVPSLYAAPTATLIVSGAEGAELELDGQVLGLLDGQREIPELAMGAHVVVVRADGFHEWRREFDLRVDRFELNVELSPIAAPRADPPLTEVRVEQSLSPLVWVGAGVIAAGGVTSGVFGARARRPLENEVTRADAVAEQESRERDALIANIGFAAVGVGVVVLVTGLILSRKRTTIVPRASVDVALGPGRGVVTMTVRH